MKRPPIYFAQHYVRRMGDKYAFRVGNRLEDSRVWYVTEVYKWVYHHENVDADKFKTYKEAVEWGNKTVDKLRKKK